MNASVREIHAAKTAVEMPEAQMPGSKVHTSVTAQVITETVG